MGTKNPTPISGYSTQALYTDSGYESDGYSKKITIDPGKLEDAIGTFKKGLDGKSPAELETELYKALQTKGAFGAIPAAPDIENELMTFVHNHAEQMRAMGASLTDFIACVQYAAHIGYAADPVTKQQAAMAAAYMRKEERF